MPTIQSWDISSYVAIGQHNLLPYDVQLDALGDVYTEYIQSPRTWTYIYGAS